MVSKKKRASVEWVLGLASMPAYVESEGGPYRPEMLLWIGAEGAVLGHTMGRPGQLLGEVHESLRQTIERPLVGAPHVPRRVRVASQELADVLRAGDSGIDVICAPTPELDVVMEAMREHLDEGAGPEPTYLSREISVDAMAAFFRAAAKLHRRAPWKIVPDDQSLVSVTIDELGVKGAAVSVIGQMGQIKGLVMFSDVDDFEAYLESTDAIERGEQAALPPHFVIHFERGTELPPELRAEVAEHRWEVAGPQAYPWLMAIDRDLVPRPPTATEVTLAEALALALTELLADKKAVLAAWSGGEPVTRVLSVHTHAREIEVSLRVPCERVDTPARPPLDLVGDLFELGQDGEEIDPEDREPLEQELLRRFSASPEAGGLEDVEACQFVMDFAADYFGATIATLRAKDLEALVFEIIPRKMSIEANSAGWIIEELRAFYGFLGREFGLQQAGACLRVLGSEAEKKLAVALADTSKFGMAKSLFEGGREAGFDMGSREGIEAWMRVLASQPLPASFRLPSLGPPTPPAAATQSRAKKSVRKAARKARKKNR